jgi:hypothetical protein
MRPTRLSFATILSLLVVAVLQTGCAARQIRAAQDAFNDGARSENAQRAAVLSGGQPPLDASSAALSYRTSLRLLDEELAKHKQDLTQEKLLGTAMMLRAISLWRLADLEAGSKSAPDRAALQEAIGAAKQEAGDQLGTRDRVMAEALPGLYDHDRGLQAKDLAEARRFFTSSYKVVHDASNQPNVPENHPVRIYMSLAQLSTLRSYQAAIYRFDHSGTSAQPSAEEMKNVANIHTCAKLIVLHLKPVLREDIELKKFIELINTAIGIDSVDSLQVPKDATCPFDS